MYNKVNKNLVGVISIDKPEGYTSFDVVSVVRKITGQRKIGHAGTLDPLATGVLPILFGSATKAQSILPFSDKEYIFSFRLGMITDTQDITGKVLKINKGPFSVSYDKILSVSGRFLGNTKQIPPMFSALKKDGQRLYSLARNGVEVKREPREICIDDIKVLSFDEEKGEGKIFVHCSKGTYVRSLCSDIGDLLGCGAVLTGLRRVMACGFYLEDSLSLDELKEAVKCDKLSDQIIPIDMLFKSYPFVVVTDSQATRFSNGGYLSIERLNNSKSFVNDMKVRVYNKDNFFLGLGEVKDERLLIYKIFKG